MKKHIILAELVAAILVVAIFAAVCGRERAGALEMNAPHDLQALTADQSGTVERAQVRADKRK